MNKVSEVKLILNNSAISDDDASMVSRIMIQAGFRDRGRIDSKELTTFSSYVRNEEDVKSLQMAVDSVRGMMKIFGNKDPFVSFRLNEN